MGIGRKRNAYKDFPEYIEDEIYKFKAQAWVDLGLAGALAFMKLPIWAGIFLVLSFLNQVIVFIEQKRLARKVKDETEVPIGDASVELLRESLIKLRWHAVTISEAESKLVAEIQERGGNPDTDEVGKVPEVEVRVSP